MLKQNLPQFSSVDPSAIIAELQQLLADNRQALKNLLDQTQNYTWDNLLSPLEEIDDRVHLFWSPINHLNSVMNSAPLREAYNASLPLLTEYQTEIGHNKRLYQAICQIAEGPEYPTLNSAQKMLIKHILRDFKLAGVALPETEKLRFAELSKELSQLSTQFEENVLDATNGWNKPVTQAEQLAGIPDIAVQAAKEAADKAQVPGWLLTLNMPSYLAVMLHADVRELRQEMYYAFVTRASDQGPNAGQWDNGPIIDKILTRQLEKAKLLGFENYAQRSLATKMVKSTAEVLDFLNHLLGAALAAAKTEMDEVREFALKKDGLKELMPWDIAYYSEKLRTARYDISQEELRAYFPIDKALSGLFTIVKRLFGIEMRPVQNVDVWHSDVTCYAVYDQQGELRSYFYLDLYARAHKRGGAWMDEYCGRRLLKDGSIQKPVAYLTCNFQAPVGKKPSLLMHEEVITLFHEFGHSLQHMLTSVDYAGVAGINGVPWDAVEVASQFLENWAWEKESIHFIAQHYQTKQELSDELLQRMWRAKNFQKAMQTIRQIEFALFDFELHMQYDPSQNQQTQKILDHVRGRTSLMTVPIYNRFQNSFSHIFAGGYSAGYYSYKWAEVMASDAFGLFKEKGIFDLETSQKFLHTFLESGGAVDPLDLFIQFRGRPPQVNALLEQSGII